MKRFLWPSVIVVFLLTGSPTCSGDARPTVRIASFNILRLGQDGYDAEKDWAKTVEMLVQFHIVSLLEVITDDLYVRVHGDGRCV